MRVLAGIVLSRWAGGSTSSSMIRIARQVADAMMQRMGMREGQIIQASWGGSSAAAAFSKRRGILTRLRGAEGLSQCRVHWRQRNGG
jgi:hypothetical protein